MKVNAKNLTDVAIEFGWVVVVPMLEWEDVDTFLSRMIADALIGDVPDWLVESVLLLDFEFEDVDILDFYRELVIQIPTYVF